MGKSKHTVSEFSGLKKIVGSFVINDREVGNYKIFKIKDILNRFWVVSEEIKEKIERAGLVGIKLLGCRSIMVYRVYRRQFI